MPKFAVVGRLSRVALITLVSALIAIQLIPASAQDRVPFPTLEPALPSPQAQVFQANPSQFFYYYEGQRITLEVAPELVAVRFKSGGDINQQRAAVSQVRPELQQADATVHTNPDYVLFRVPSQMSAQGSLNVVNQLRQNQNLVQWANPVFRVPGGYAVLTDEFIARFPASWNEEQVRSFNATNGVEIQSRLLSNDNSYVLRTTGTVALNGVVGVDALTLANLYQESGQVVFAEPNFSNLIERLFTPNDTYFGQQWALNNTGQLINNVAAGTPDADIDAAEAWNMTTGSSSIIIAILDDAFDPNHPDLGTGTSKMVPGYDAFTGTGNIFPTPGTSMAAAHGTATAGLAAAIGNNAMGVTGVCMNCRIMPIQVFNDSGAATNAGFANGINYAWQNGAHILSNSWGGGSPSTAITNAIDAALSSGRGGKGSVVVFAAGNSFNQPVSYPGSLTQVITVAATNLCDQRKAPTNNSCNYFENWWGPNSGPQVDVAAPGVGLFSTDRLGAFGFASGDYVANFNGTSGSTPIVSGVAGLMLSVNPNLTAARIQTLLRNTADDIAPAGIDTGTGKGRVNAFRAVDMARRPANDRIAQARVVTSPSSIAQDPAWSTKTADEPTTCANGGVNTVWFKYTATANRRVTINTAGSNYNTVLSVYTGNPGSLTQVRCNNNVGGLLTSSVTLNVTNGTTYYIMVAKAGTVPFTTGATLNLNLLHPAPASAVRQPVIESTEAIEPEVTPEVTDEVEVTETVEPEITETIAPEVTDEIEVTESPTPFPTLPLEGPSESTVTPTPFPTLPPEGPSEPIVTPIPTLQYITLPARASMDDGALDWQRSTGWLLTADAAFGSVGAGWQVTATNTVEALRWSLPLDLRTVVSGQTVEFTYLSLLNNALSTALVQVSVDGTNWITVSAAGASADWTVETVDLTSFIGQLVYVQFVWNGVAPSDQTQSVDLWQVDEVNVRALTPVTLPSATPTATAEVITVEPPTPTETELPPATPTETAVPSETPLPTPEGTALVEDGS